VLQDRMFEPNASWSLPQHLFMVSEWSAYCATASAQSSRNAQQSPGLPPDFQGPRPAPTYSWTDLSYLLHKAGVSWKYYVQAGLEPDCRNDAADFPPVNQNAKTPGIWNPLPYFTTVQTDGQLANIPGSAATTRTPGPARSPPSRGSPRASPTASTPRPAWTTGRRG